MQPVRPKQQTLNRHLCVFSSIFCFSVNIMVRRVCLSYSHLRSGRHLLQNPLSEGFTVGMRERKKEGGETNFVYLFDVKRRLSLLDGMKPCVLFGHSYLSERVKGIDEESKRISVCVCV